MIEWELNDVYDISGWDLDKTLKLLHSSNPVIFEWVNSPIVYKETEFLKQFCEFCKSYFMTIKGAHHYLHMAQKNYDAFLSGDRVKLKKYFYVLRPIFATRYVLKYRSNPPMLFEELLEEESDEEFKKEVYKLIEAKRNSSELGEADKIDILNDYIRSELAALSEEVNSLEKEQTSWDGLNKLFIDTIYNR